MLQLRVPGYQIYILLELWCYLVVMKFTQWSVEFYSVKLPRLSKHRLWPISYTFLLGNFICILCQLLESHCLHSASFLSLTFKKMLKTIWITIWRFNDSLQSQAHESSLFSFANNFFFQSWHVYVSLSLFPWLCFRSSL